MGKIGLPRDVRGVIEKTLHVSEGKRSEKTVSITSRSSQFRVLRLEILNDACVSISFISCDSVRTGVPVSWLGRYDRRGRTLFRDYKYLPCLRQVHTCPISAVHVNNIR